MKMKAEKFNLLRDTIVLVVAHYGGAKAVMESYAGAYTGLLWKLHGIATDNLQFSDDHPCFADGTWPRIAKHVPGYRTYTDGLMDAHIETALRKIGRELNLQGA